MNARTVRQTHSEGSSSRLGGMAPIGAVAPYDAVIFDLDGAVTEIGAEQRVFASSTDLARRLRAGGTHTGLLATDRQTRLLGSDRLADLFTVAVDAAGGHGTDDEIALAALAETAARLDVPAARCAVVASTVCGVRAAHRGGFGLVVGITPSGHRRDFEAAGAEIVLGDVAQLDLGALRADPWLLVYEGFDPAHEGHREALTTLANGYLGTRGCVPERADDGVHYPGAYLAGVYNRLTSLVDGRQVEHESLVNTPNWLHLDLRIDSGLWWSQAGLTARRDRRELDLRRGVLTRRLLLVDEAGRLLQVTQRRLVSMHNSHMAALETTLVPQGWSGRITVRSGIDAEVTNSNVTEYGALANRHLDVLTAHQVDSETVVVEAVTTQSQIRIATASRTVVTGPRTEPSRQFDSRTDGLYAHLLDTPVWDGQPTTIDKTVAVSTSRDAAISSPLQGALDQLGRSPNGYRQLLPEHEAAWARLWDRFAIDLDTDRETRLVLNLHVFHLLQTISPHTTQLDVGVPARGLHGEGYRGHVFWDELFVQPLITAHLPSVTQALLEYRWRRLDTARHAAAKAGLAGALFPWQSGSDGREETPNQLLNLRSHRWMPDNSRLQFHVGLAVAYNAWQYYEATGDIAWLAERGAELIIEVVRLFAALATYEPDTDRYHISGVMGPDEYHDGYPDVPGAGLRDNTYTNILTAWVCQRAADIMTVLGGHECAAVLERLGVESTELALWEHLSRRLTVSFNADGIMSQFDGYESLAELDWERYRRTYGNIERLDLILAAEGDSTNRYKLAKQADVLMLIYLLGADELLTILRRLDYNATDDTLPRTIDYYLARTAHGSTLSRVVHASVLANVNAARAWDTFRDALVADLDDTQGGTTREGIHLGAMAGTVDIITHVFAGRRIQDGILTFAPHLPEDLRRVAFQVQFRGHRIDVTLDHDRLRLAARPCATAPIPVDVAGSRFTLGGGHVRDISLRGHPGQ